MDMKEDIYITEKELEYYSNPISNEIAKEAVVQNRPKMTWEEKLKFYECITIDEFSERIGESIRRLIPD